MRFQWRILCVLVALHQTFASWAHSTGPSDLFPLKSGLFCRYEYYSSAATLDMGSGGYTVDSGTVAYLILDSLEISPTVRAWHLQAVTHLIHQHYYAGPGYRSAPDTLYSMDSTSFDMLYENLDGQHKLTCNTLVWSFPIADALLDIDTSAHSLLDVYRFGPEPSSLLVAHLWFPGPGKWLTDSLWFDIHSGFTKRLFFQSQATNSRKQRKLSAILLASPTSMAEATSALPRDIELAQNYPNPFNPSTTIPFRLDQPTEVTVEVFDILGKCVATLFRGTLPAGAHEIKFDGARCSGGVYFSRLTTPQRVAVSPMILMR
jgi:hypothetical protein